VESRGVVEWEREGGGKGKAKRAKKKPPALKEQSQKPSGAMQTISSR
jgi:hypothetical protein